ncbi:MAG TPA: nitrile hydratase subunit alpha [Thermohalobaculum sp.]|nr:nitrile hydratase subunit alpha [Thermohalobaculum sp.]
MPHDHHEHFHHEGMSPSGHPYRPDNDTPLTYWQRMEIAVRELLVEKGIATAAEINAQIERMDARSPAQGARVVARAWDDPSFRERLIADGTAAIEEMGIEPDGLKLVVVENTDAVHNVVVCTLCSCYPRNLLGLPPDWYKTRAYRARMVREPRAVLAEFGLELPGDLEVRVHDSTADMRYMVLPRRPEGTEGWPRERLAGLVSRDCMIGVALPRPA